MRERGILPCPCFSLRSSTSWQHAIERSEESALACKPCKAVDLLGLPSLGRWGAAAWYVPCAEKAVDRLVAAAGSEESTGQDSRKEQRMAFFTEAQERTEGRVATAIERQTARLPSDLFLWLAGGSILGSLALRIMNRRDDANFVGEWAPTFLILGLYNKLVKLHGHDMENPTAK
jgi:hypothetical protein